MKTKICFLSFLFFLANLLFSQEETQYKPNIFFRFLDFENELKIIPDEVRLKKIDSNNPKKFSTKITNSAMALDIGDYSLEVTKSNYKTSITILHVENSIKKLDLNIYLSHKEYKYNPILTKRNKNALLLYGYLSDIEGEPIPDVKIYDRNAKLIGQSDTIGFYNILLNIDSKFVDSERGEHLYFEKSGYEKVILKNLPLDRNADTRINIKLTNSSNTETKYASKLIYDNDGFFLRTNESNSTSDNLTYLHDNLPYISAGLTCNISNSIRVGSNCTSGSNCSTVNSYSLDDYSRWVLSKEWAASNFSKYSNSMEAFKAGAVAVRSYAQYYIEHPRGNNFDICNDTYCQAFTVNSTNSNTDQAIIQTVGYLLQKNGVTQNSEYSSENNHLSPVCPNQSTTGITDCSDGYFTKSGIGGSINCKYDAVGKGHKRSGHGRGMSQFGSIRWASGLNIPNFCETQTSNPSPHNQGTKTWQAILSFYYSDFDLVLCSPQAAPPNDNCPGSPLTSLTSCSYTLGTVNGATASGKPKSSCDVFTSTASLLDVWYSFTAISTTHIINIRPLGTMDAVVSVYNSCSSTAPISGGCKDDSGVGTITDFNVTGLTVGNTYYIRVYDYGNVAPANGSFNICVTHQANNPCTTTISAPSRSFSSDGGSGSFNVSMSPLICTYSATSSCLWVTLNSYSGAGGGAITYTVAQNLSTSSRNCAINVNGQIHTITQSGLSCNYSASPATQDVTAIGGNGSFNLTTSSGCTWTASTNCNWVTLNNPSGSGSSTISYTISANTSISSRTCTINVNGQTYTITQAGVAQVCSYSFNPSSNIYTFDEQIGKLNVVANSGCDWIATSNNSWINVLTPSGSGNGEVSFSISKNTRTNEQMGTVKISGRSPNSTYEAYFNVLQTGMPVCNYSITPSSQTFTASGGNGSFNLTTSSGCIWTASTNCNWTALTNASGTNSSTISYTVSANTTTSSRICTITVNGQTYTISQSGASCNYSINSNSQSFASSGGNGSFNLTTSSGCTWTVSTDCNWVALTNASGSNSSIISYTVSANTTTSSRTCTITVNGQTYTISQSGASCSYSLSSSSQSFASSGGNGSFNLTTSSGCAWSASSDCDWVTITNPNGKGSTDIEYTFKPNLSNSDRICIIKINGLSHTITQLGGTCNYTITPSSKSFSASAGNGSFSISTLDGCKWTATEDCPWVTLGNTSSSGTSSSVISYKFDANNTNVPRNCIITVNSQTHTVTQAPANCNFAISNDNQKFREAGGSGFFTLTTTGGCPWLASPDCDWVVLENNSGAGNATINYTVKPNQLSSIRECIISINGLTHTITQEAACAYKIEGLATQKFIETGGNGSLIVTTNCNWSALISCNWVKADKMTGTGTSPFNYSVEPNDKIDERVCTIKINGQTHTIIQAGIKKVLITVVTSTGGIATETKEYLAGDVVDLVATPNKCFKFINWTENGSEVSKNLKISFPANANRNLVANFRESPKYNISINPNPGTGGTVMGNGVYCENEEITLKAIEDSKYKFINWTSGGKVIYTNSIFPIIVQKDSIITANFELRKITITTVTTNGGTLTGGKEYFAGDLITVKATPDKCFKFVNWTENGTVVSIDSIYTFSSLYSRNLIANFEGRQYKLDVKPTTGGRVQGGGGVFCLNELTQLTAIPDSGYKFSGWRNCSATSTLNTATSFILKVTKDSCLIAQFTKTSTSLFDIEDLGKIIISPNPNNGIFNISFELNKIVLTDIEIFNSIGQMIYSKTLKNQNSAHTETIDIGNVAKGIYLVKIRIGQKEIVEKIFIN